MTRKLLLERLPVLLTQGRTPLAALTQLQIKNLPDGSHILKALERGKTLSIAASSQFTPPETLTIATGEEAGQLGATLLAIYDLQELHKQTRLKILTGLAYPLLLTLAACLLIPTSSILTIITTHNWMHLALVKLTALAIITLWLLLVVALWISLSPTTRERLILHTPILQAVWKTHKTMVFSRMLQWLLKTSLDIGTAAKKAADCTGSRLLEQEASLWQETATKATPIFTTTHILLKDFADDLQAYEETGTLTNQIDEMAKHVKQQYNHTLLRSIALVNGGCYFLSIVLTGYSIVSFYAGYFDLLLKQL